MLVTIDCDIFTEKT